MPRSKSNNSTAKKKAVKKVNVPDPEDPSELERDDLYDVQVDYSLKLQSPKDGTIVNINGKLPLQGALHPVFIKESLRTIEDTVESVVKRRFLTQVRHFFYSILEEDSSSDTSADNNLLTETVKPRELSDSVITKDNALTLQYEEENETIIKNNKEETTTDVLKT